MAVGKEVEAGAELFNNYGPKSNQELLRLYGFVLEVNPQDTYDVEVAGLAAEDDAELEVKQQLLAAMGEPKLHVLRRLTAERKRKTQQVGSALPESVRLSTVLRLFCDCFAIDLICFDAQVVCVVPVGLLRVLRLARKSTRNPQHNLICEAVSDRLLVLFSAEPRRAYGVARAAGGTE